MGLQTRTDNAELALELLQGALYKFVEGTEVSKPIMDEVMDNYSIYDLTKVK